MGHELRRITVDEVKEAMDKTGAKLETMITWSEDDFGKGNPCGCPIGIVAASMGVYNKERDSGNRLDDAADAIGLKEHYVSGFVHGFDGWEPDDDDKEYELGHADGRAVADALLPKSDNR